RAAARALLGADAEGRLLVSTARAVDLGRVRRRDFRRRAGLPAACGRPAGCPCSASSRPESARRVRREVMPAWAHPVRRIIRMPGGTHGCASSLLALIRQPRPLAWPPRLRRNAGRTRRYSIAPGLGQARALDTEQSAQVASAPVGLT